MKNKVKGFTMVELIVVIAILGVLAGALVPNAIMWIRNSKLKTCNSEAKTVFNTAVTVLQDYQLEGKLSEVASDGLAIDFDKDDISSNIACEKINNKLGRSFTEASQWKVRTKVENSTDKNKGTVTVLCAIYSDNETSRYVGRYPLLANKPASGGYSSVKDLVLNTTGTDDITN